MRSNVTQQSFSPSRSTIGLTSQQKDLIIIHLKSEVYELKQSESDYKSLLSQVQQLEDRLRYLRDEKEITLRDYQGKINGQDKQIEMNKRELDELRRITGNKDIDIEDIRSKLQQNKEKINQADLDYQQLRDSNEDVLRFNKHIKDEIVSLEDRLDQEKSRAVDLRGVKDKLSHNLYRGADDYGAMMLKEEDLKKRQIDKQYEQQSKEDKLRQLEREDLEKEQKRSNLKNLIVSEELKISQLQNQIAIQQQENERLVDQQRKSKTYAEVEEVKLNENHTRLREFNDKLSRRDQESDGLQVDIQTYDKDNHQLKQRYEQLLMERNALREHSEKILKANKEIEKELDSFVNLDDSIVRTLEKRDEKLSPVLSQSQYNAARIHQANSSLQIGLQQSRMFDISNVDQVRLAPYSQQFGSQYGQYQSHARLNTYQNDVLSRTANKYDQQTVIEDFRRSSLGEAQYLTSSVAVKDTQALKFLNPRTLGPSQVNSSRRDLQDSQREGQRERRNSPLRQHFE